MQITNAKYNWNLDKTGNGEAIKATIDGVEIEVPTDPANRHYAEIMRQVEAGELTIAEAE